MIIFGSQVSYWFVAGVLILILAIHKIYIQLTHPLRKFPGPPLAAWSNAPFSYWFLQGRQPFTMKRLHDKYGPVVRVAPNELSFNTAQSWKDIYGFRSNHKTFIKSDFYDGGSFTDQGVHSVVTSRDVVEHAGMRRWLSHAFSERALREQVELVAETVDLLVDKLDEQGKVGSGVVDLERWLRHCAFDIMGSLAFGQSFDALENNASHPSLQFIQKALKQLSALDTTRRFPWLGAIAMVVFKKQVDELMQGNKKHEEHCLLVVQRRLSNPTQRGDFLTRLIENSKDDKNLALQLAAHTADLMQAGTDTSNTTIITLLHYALRDPRLMKNLEDEILPRFSHYSQITAQSTNNLPYTRALCHEAMRLYPPVPVGLPRITPEGGDFVSGFFIPEGTIVSTNPLATNLSENNFKDPWEFRPERWLGKGKEGGDILDASQPFSMGPRGCLGQNLSWIEMNTILAKLIYMFDFELMNKGVNLHRDTRMDSLWHGPPLMVKVTRREGSIR